MIIEDTYVDDVITGENNYEEVVNLRDEIVELLKCGVFSRNKIRDMTVWCMAYNVPGRLM
ncbi:hypothetical protein LAZ67_16002202 [Cordylochernes scorpioides]|uniref:Reverse transcriptase n=1 Tax=Cordylochernes scorpioides TaxID=51811 RepID=A0ABY6LC52_9ARAC|nr:hypothetical protein LAZ67_16002202 [Cordylochernes scorpioides]